MPGTTPKHKHDCAACRHLATLGGLDHYVCDEFGETSAIIRHGSRGQEYRSMPLDLAARLDIPEYRVVVALAGVA